MRNADGGVGCKACATSFKLLLRSRGIESAAEETPRPGFCLRSFRVSSETMVTGDVSPGIPLLAPTRSHNLFGCATTVRVRRNANKRVSPPRIRVPLMRKVALSETHRGVYSALGIGLSSAASRRARPRYRASLCVNHRGRKEKNHKDKNPAPENKAPRIFRRGMHGFYASERF